MVGTRGMVHGGDGRVVGAPRGTGPGVLITPVYHCLPLFCAIFGCFVPFWVISGPFPAKTGHFPAKTGHFRVKLALV